MLPSFTYKVSNVEEKLSSFKEQKGMTKEMDLCHLDAGWSGIHYYGTMY